jgi:hypothetical protein
VPHLATLVADHGNLKIVVRPAGLQQVLGCGYSGLPATENDHTILLRTAHGKPAPPRGI